MSWEEKEILLAVKTYPERSKKYGNTVCTAGILMDSNEWVRIYPINFDSYKAKPLKKFVQFKAHLKKNTKETLKRKESYNIRDSTIEVTKTDLVDPSIKGVWDKRRNILEKTLSDSIESLVASNKEKRTSLGIVKPKLNTLKFKLKKPIEKIEIDIAKDIQMNLFGEKLQKVDKIEKIFYYSFKCGGNDCSGHKMICTDWELLQSFRTWKEKYTDPEILEEKLRKKYENWMKKRDLHFILGTHNRFGTWFIIGLFYPPKREALPLNDFFK